MQLRGVLFYRSMTHYCEPGPSWLIPEWHPESGAIKRRMLPAAGQTMKGLKPFGSIPKDSYLEPRGLAATPPFFVIYRLVKEKVNWMCLEVSNSNLCMGGSCSTHVIKFRQLSQQPGNQECTMVRAET